MLCDDLEWKTIPVRALLSVAVTENLNDTHSRRLEVAALCCTFRLSSVPALIPPSYPDPIKYSQRVVVIHLAACYRRTQHDSVLPPRVSVRDILKVEQQAQVILGELRLATVPFFARC